MHAEPIVSERSVRVMLDDMGILHGTSIERTAGQRYVRTGRFRGTGAWRIATRYFRRSNELQKVKAGRTGRE